MRLGARVEIHFYEQEKAAVYLETLNTGPEEEYSEICLFALYAARTATTVSGEISSSLGQVLAAIGPELNELAETDRTANMMIVPYQGHGGRYSFTMDFLWTDDDFRCLLKPKGFGLFGRGTLYYCPASVMALLHFLARRRRNSEFFLDRVAEAARLCGIAIASGEVGLTNNAEIALACVKEAYAVHPNP